MLWKQLNTPAAQQSETCCRIGKPDTVWRNLQPSLYAAHSRIDRMTGKGHTLELDAMGHKLALRIPEIAAVSFPTFHKLLRLFA
jgi:hypothetical protein